MSIFEFSSASLNACYFETDSASDEYTVHGSRRYHWVLSMGAIRLGEPLSGSVVGTKDQNQRTTLSQRLHILLVNIHNLRLYQGCNNILTL